MSKELYANAALHRFVRYDARNEIFDAVGDLADVELFGTQLLVAPYVRSGILFSPMLGFPETKVLSQDELYGLYESGKGFMAQKFAAEDIYQGKVCLVLKLGAEVESCGSASAIKEATGRPLRAGDWIFTLQENTRGVSLCGPGGRQSRVLKALGIEYAGWPSKFLLSSDIYGRLDDPNILA